MPVNLKRPADEEATRLFNEKRLATAANRTASPSPTPITRRDAAGSTARGLVVELHNERSLELDRQREMEAARRDASRARSALADAESELERTSSDKSASEAQLVSQRDVAAMLQNELMRSQAVVAARDKAIQQLTSKKEKLVGTIADLRKDAKDVRAAYNAAQAAKETAVRETGEMRAAREQAERAMHATQIQAQQRVSESETALRRCNDELEETRQSRLRMQSRVGGLVKASKQRLNPSPLRHSPLRHSHSTTPTATPEHGQHASRSSTPAGSGTETPELPTMTGELLARPVIPRASRESAKRRVGSLNSFEMAAALGPWRWI